MNEIEENNEKIELENDNSNDFKTRFKQKSNSCWYDTFSLLYALVIYLRLKNKMK